MKRIAISSVLKPANEVRMYERLAKTLSKSNKYEINLIGIQPKSFSSEEKNIKFKYINARNRGLSSRISALVQTYRHLKKIQPDVYICTSPDLCLLGSFYKRFNKCKVVFDLQEDYRANLENQQIYTGINKRLVRLVLNLTEKYIYPSIDHFILAEKAYQNLGFVENRFTILENKFADNYKLDILKSENKDLKFLFSGVISDYSGIQNAVEIWKKIYAVYPDSELKIIGICYQKSINDYLKIEEAKQPNISLVGIDEFVNHKEIIESVISSDFGFITHQYSNSNSDRIPTKLYEYNYFNLPFIIETNTKWEEIGSQLGTAISVDYQQLNIEKLLKTLLSIKISTQRRINRVAGWESEEPKLLVLFDTLFK